jgi:hypothetical protein
MVNKGELMKEQLIKALTIAVEKEEYISEGKTPSVRSARVVEWDVIERVLWQNG